MHEHLRPQVRLTQQHPKSSCFCQLGTSGEMRTPQQMLKACSAHPIAGKERRILSNPSLLAGQYTPGSLPPFPECPPHYIIPARDQHSALLCLDVFLEFPICWDFMLFHYITFSGVSFPAVNVVKFKVSIVLLSLSLGVTASKQVIPAGYEKEREKDRNGGG